MTKVYIIVQCDMFCYVLLFSIAVAQIDVAKASAGMYTCIVITLLLQLYIATYTCKDILITLNSYVRVIHKYIN